MNPYELSARRTKAEKIAAEFMRLKITAENVAAVIHRDQFWLDVARATDTNYASLETRAMVVEILAGAEVSDVPW